MGGSLGLGFASAYVRGAGSGAGRRVAQRTHGISRTTTPEDGEFWKDMRRPPGRGARKGGRFSKDSWKGKVVLFFYPRLLRAKSERMMRGAMRCGWMSWQRVGYGACFCLPGCPAALVLRWMGGAVECSRWGLGGYV